MKSNVSYRAVARAVSSFEGLESRRLFAVAYSITDLTPAVGADASAQAYGVSNSGIVALGYRGHAAYWKNGVVTDLGITGYATDVNDNGILCGVDTTGGGERPFVYADKKEKFLLADGDRGSATAINNSGTVVGTINAGDLNESQGYETPLNGATTVVPVPIGFSTTELTGINDNGLIFGSADNPGPSGPDAFTYDGTNFRTYVPHPGASGGPTNFSISGHGISNNGVLAFGGEAAAPMLGPPTTTHLYTVDAAHSGLPIDRGTLDDTGTISANDLNASGIIAATFVDANGVNSAAVFDGTSTKSLTTLINANENWTLTTAVGVSDSGQIVGTGVHAGKTHAYLLTPVAAPPVNGSISGTVFNDNDADGVFDSNEVGSGVRTVFLDANKNNKLDSGEVSVQSDASGKYIFKNVPAGVYHVERVLPTGYRLTNNANGYVEVQVAAGQAVTNVNLGSAPNTTPPKVGSITGVVFNDDDKDGVLDSNEKPSGVRTVYIDANGNGKLDSGEKSTQSNSTGVYKFDGLAAGSYKVSRVFPAGYHLTGTQAAYLTITVASGQNVTGVNIGSGTNA